MKRKRVQQKSRIVSTILYILLSLIICYAISIIVFSLWLVSPKLSADWHVYQLRYSNLPPLSEFVSFEQSSAGAGKMAYSYSILRFTSELPPDEILAFYGENVFVLSCGHDGESGGQAEHIILTDESIGNIPVYEICRVSQFD